jgi:XTP/dITP diphosphohydrolase
LPDGSKVIELLVATTNPGKFAEVQAFLENLPLRILSLENISNPPSVIEDGKTFEENALKKARALADFTGLLALADDSGLEVDALDGAPGIYSARYAGAGGDDERNNTKLLHTLENVPRERRTARFVCALALCAPRSHGKQDWTVRESCEGEIAFTRAGRNGFGYDPLFFYPPLGKTFGEIDQQTKATVSHRGKALQRLAEALPMLLDARIQT